jgi:hypothetical protein
MDCAQTREQLEAYVLDVLDPSERTKVERHLEGCEECRERARALAGVAGRLPEALLAAAPISPPGALKERVLRRLDGEEPARPRPRLRVSLPRPRGLAVGLAAAGLALILGLAAGLQIAVARERDRRAELAMLVGQQELVFEIVDSRETEQAFLRTRYEQGAFAESYGKLYTRPNFRDVVAFGARLPQATEGRAYHLWVTRDGRTRLAGVLTVRDGFGLVVFRADRPGPSFDAAELRLQKRGSGRLTGELVLAWRATD